MSAEMLAGQSALVTGGGTGIGQAVAIGLAQLGCKVAIVGRRADKLAATAQAAATNPALLHYACDVSRPDDVKQLFDWASQQLGPIDILVNSAGVNVLRRKLGELSVEDWQLMMDVNVNGAFYCMQAVLPEMRKRQAGLIINISSVAGKRASLLGGVGYSASKFAMTALGLTAAREEGPNGIRITNIYPGEVNTPILDQRPEPVSDEHKARILQPADVAAAVLMVAQLPPQAHVSELIIKPTSQDYA